MDNLYYAKRLSEMIKCKTISKKDSFEPEEFLKLREVLSELFPLVYETAELTILGDDTYLYKIKGLDENRNVLVMSHHDVVAASNNWSEEPFGGEINDGKIWGRGTVDTKTPLFGEFSALEELISEGFKFPVNVYLFSSCNEEIGGNGAPLALEYFKENNITFEWISDEGGAIVEPPMKGIDKKCAMMAVHEKGRCTCKLIAKKIEGHAGLEGNHKTPVMRLANFISEVDSKKPFIRKLHPEVRAMFEAMEPHISFPMNFVFSNLWLFSGLLVKLIPNMNATAGEMLGTGCTFKNFNTFEDGTCEAEAFLRCISGDDLAKDIGSLKEIAKKYGVEITIKDNEYYKPSSLDSKGYKHIRDTILSVFDYVAAVPFILPAGTDARTFTDLSDAVIRFAPIDIDNQQYASVHNDDENFSIDKLGLVVKFYKELLKNYR